MAIRVLFGVVILVNIWVVVVCTDPYAETYSSSSATTTVQGSRSSSTAISRSSSRSRTRDNYCKRIKKCPKNEEYSYCLQSIGRPQYCTEKGQNFISESLDGKCKEGCVCKRDYLRADNGTCIPEEQCETTCGPNEELDNCPVDCDSDYCPTSEDDKTTCLKPEDADCAPAECKCIFNYRRAFNGSCIPTESCPPFDCSSRVNEEYDPCPPLCPTDDCSQATPTGECPEIFGNIGIVLPCNPACRCIEGYWRLNGTCVSYGQCPGVCPENERYSECIQSECVALNCSQKDQPIPCPRIRPEYCIKGCVCEENYLRDSNGECVPEDQCDANDDCPPNEQFSTCTQVICRAQECKEKNWPIACPSIVEGSCISGCVCKDGYLRDDNSTCIPEDECIPNPCQPNEEYSECTQSICRPLNCREINDPIVCPVVAEEDCTPGCVCQENYLRNDFGYCAPADQCSPDTNTCPQNEVWTECTQTVCRTQDCSQKGKPVACPSIIAEECISGCVCQNNYLRNDAGECIPEDKCTISCDDNQTQVSCLSSCTSDYCPSSENEEQVCSNSDFCTPGCKCDFNYRIGDDGTCIPTTSCPPFDCSARPNEVYDPCPPLCPSDECSLPRVTGRCPFRIGVRLECNPKCRCMDGYGRVNGTCVSFYDCPNLCPANEEYSPCVQATCRPQTCSEKDTVYLVCPPYDSDSCQRGCVCQANYYRNDDGNCVPYDECPVNQCATNEEYSTCVQATCRPQNCLEKDTVYDVCPAYEIDSCETGCVCQANYYRNENGICVPYDECPANRCPINEEYSTCIQATCRPQSCAEKETVYQVCPTYASDSCETGCVCQENYYRNDYGNCVPYQECPANQCPANEEYSTCVQATCRPQTCAERDTDYQACRAYDREYCQTGCICQNNYYRNDYGICVPYDQCDAVCGPNEESRCVTSCPPEPSCRNRGIEFYCLQVFEPCQYRCVCKKGYYRNAIGECITNEQCDRCLKPNEYYSCGQECDNVCSSLQRQNKTNCPIINIQCNKKCYCDDGYARDYKGNCIPIAQCPPSCADENEEYLKCSRNCPPDLCVSIVARYDCRNATCEPGCSCKSGYYRKKPGTPCIPFCECPEMRNSPDCAYVVQN